MPDRYSDLGDHLGIHLDEPAGLDIAGNWLALLDVNVHEQVGLGNRGDLDWCDDHRSVSGLLDPTAG